MEEIEDVFISKYDNDLFDEIYSETTSKLLKENTEYIKLHNRLKDIIKQNKKVQAVLENGDKTEITKEESRLIYEYNIIMIDLHALESKEIFIKGMKEAYYLFKRLGVIK